MLLSALSVLVVAQSSSEIPEGLTNNPVVQYCEEYSLLGCDSIVLLEAYRNFGKSGCHHVQGII